MLVVYGGLTGMKETSVGNLFAGAILPGLILSGLYLAYVAIRCMINPQLGPVIPKEERVYSLGQKVAMTMKSFVPPFGLILTVMGTILAGIATPTEAAALGCLGALALALIGRKTELAGHYRILRFHRPDHGHDHGPVRRRKIFLGGLSEHGRRGCRCPICCSGWTSANMSFWQS